MPTYSRHDCIHSDIGAVSSYSIMTLLALITVLGSLL